MLSQITARKYSGDIYMLKSWIALIVTMAVVVSPVQTGAQNQAVVLDGGTLIDGTGKNPINNAVVVVEGGRIKAVGSKGQVSVPAGAQVIKTDGRTILPGLIDGHIHLGSNPGNPLMPQMFLKA